MADITKEMNEILKKFKDSIDNIVKKIQNHVKKEDKEGALKFFAELSATWRAWTLAVSELQKTRTGIATREGMITTDTSEAITMASQRANMTDEAIKSVKPLLNAKGWL